MKTLVTGGTGFLGSHLVSGLARSSRGAGARTSASSCRARRPRGCATSASRSCPGSVTKPEDVARAARRRRPRLPPRGHGLAQAQRRAPHVRRPRRRHARPVRGRRRGGRQAHRHVLDERHDRGVDARRRHARRGLDGAARGHRALALLHEQALPGRDGAPRVRRQGRARDGQPEPAARARATIA